MDAEINERREAQFGYDVRNRTTSRTDVLCQSESRIYDGVGSTLIYTCVFLRVPLWFGVRMLWVAKASSFLLCHVDEAKTHLFPNPL